MGRPFLLQELCRYGRLFCVPAVLCRLFRNTIKGSILQFHASKSKQIHKSSNKRAPFSETLANRARRLRMGGQTKSEFTDRRRTAKPADVGKIGFLPLERWGALRSLSGSLRGTMESHLRPVDCRQILSGAGRFGAAPAELAAPWSRPSRTVVPSATEIGPWGWRT